MTCIDRDLAYLLHLILLCGADATCGQNHADIQYPNTNSPMLHNQSAFRTPRDVPPVSFLRVMFHGLVLQISSIYHIQVDV